MLQLNKSIRMQQGFSLIEVMVALVVLGVGMLGMAGLYVTTLQANGTAISRTQAVNLAADLAERIRANPRGQTNYAPTTAPISAANNCYTTATSCTPEQLAADDLFIWGEQVLNLPGTPTGKVVFTPGIPCSTPDNYSIKLDWSEPTVSGLSYVLNVQTAITC